MTRIEWTDETWNPLRGCTRISEGCRNCYAERIAARFSGPGEPFESAARMVNGQPRWTGNIRFVPEALGKPLHWKKPRMVFVNSMSDLFHEMVPFEFVDRVFVVMSRSPQHTFQVLTKRAERMAEYVRSRAELDGHNAFCLAKWTIEKTHYPKPHVWPLPNVWLGVSVENQEAADRRIPFLLQTPAVVRFLSCEPLLGPMDLSTYLDIWRYDDTMPWFYEGHEIGLHWAITGAESGPGARPMDEDWVRSLRDQCVAAGVPLFYKQRLDDKGHKVPTPELDGRRWTEYPEVKGA